MRVFLRRVLPLLIALVALVVALYFVVGIPLKKGREDWAQGHYAHAIDGLTQWSRLHLRSGDYDEMLAVVYLTVGKDDLAKPLLDKLAKRSASWFPVVRKNEVATVLVSRGRYEEFLMYDTAVRQHRESGDLPLYRAAAQLGVNRIPEAETTFSTVDRNEVDPAKYDALKSALEVRRSGSFPLVLDRNGKAIANYQISNHDLVAVNTDFAPLVEGSSQYALERQLGYLGTSATIETTLDSRVQRAALASLGTVSGSVVVIDVRTGELLAVASNGGPQNRAFESQYEPGSIVKVLTGMNAIDSGIDPATIFPLNCGGFLVIDGRQFFDWAPHGALPDINEALAVSCNVAFGELGLKLGADRVASMFEKAGFNHDADLIFYRVPLGKFRRQGLFNNFEIATSAIGLKHESVNALHVAMLASMIANKGQMTAPRMLRDRRTILGESIVKTPPAMPSRVASPTAAAALTKAMEAVVTSPRGTGRRAAVEGFTIAMKTGTAGASNPGYDALIMAFAPAESPRYAVGIIAEHVGPAELEGARIAHDLFEKLKIED